MGSAAGERYVVSAVNVIPHKKNVKAGTASADRENMAVIGTSLVRRDYKRAAEAMSSPPGRSNGWLHEGGIQTPEREHIDQYNSDNVSGRTVVAQSERRN